MSSLTDIATGWYHFVVASKENQELIKDRLEVCDSCEHIEQLSLLGETLVKGINKSGSLFQCGVCKCPLAAKTANPNETCPKKKW